MRKICGCGLMVWHQLPKLRVAGSSPVIRSKPKIRAHLAPFRHVSDCGHVRFSTRPYPHVTGFGQKITPPAGFRGRRYVHAISKSGSHKRAKLIPCKNVRCKFLGRGARGDPLFFQRGGLPENSHTSIREIYLAMTFFSSAKRGTPLTNSGACSPSMRGRT